MIRPLRLGTLLHRLTSGSGRPDPWLRLRCRRKLSEEDDMDSVVVTAAAVEETPTDSFSPRLLEGESTDDDSTQKEPDCWCRPPLM